MTADPAARHSRLITLFAALQHQRPDTMLQRNVNADEFAACGGTSFDPRRHQSRRILERF
ncbi:MAG: hypothetical protein HXX10_18145 [Rhodoplanes sp.]|uniref:hypothetical protein n=1 Tax=Rhodoplanes sp. TaxID=1968906 RepID=UPI0017E1A120|nr:hypothetical protein [Rhodoplanes sp.]NVO15958.1 hypothetical protein [Rhodoplanes sp.]